MTTAVMAGEIRCRYCNTRIIRKATAPWAYDCPKCKAGESSTGFDRLPTDPKYITWRQRREQGY